MPNVNNVVWLVVGVLVAICAIIFIILNTNVG